ATRLLRPVALVAVLLEDRLDVARVVDDVGNGCRRLGSRLRPENEGGGENQARAHHRGGARPTPVPANGPGQLRQGAQHGWTKHGTAIRKCPKVLSGP